MTYRGRFAPSPTGPLHFGSLIAAMASYCDARAVGGAWLVRIEDVDEPRSREPAATAILATLERYGFQWDGEVVRQRERIALYEGALARLIARGEAYPCGCSRKELELCAVGPGGERVYPGTCRDGVAQDREARAWRLVVSDEPVGFRDRLQGFYEQRLEREIGDFIVKRADGLFAYQLAVVVDDADQGITHVVRGADLLASTPRQIRLQRALGFPTPAYLHHPIAILASGEKLSKQTGATALPADPMPSLLRAWSFLGQEEPSSIPRFVTEFWDWAFRHWTTARLPPVAMLPIVPVAGPLAV